MIKQNLCRYDLYRIKLKFLLTYEQKLSLEKHFVSLIINVQIRIFKTQVSVIALRCTFHYITKYQDGKIHQNCKRLKKMKKSTAFF